MTKTCLSLTAALLGALTAAAAPAQEAGAPTREALATPPGRTASAGSLELALGAAADYSPAYPTTEFPPTRELTAVFRFDPGPPPPEVLTAVWIAEDVKGVEPDHEMGRGDLPLIGQSSGALRYSQENALPAGKYRLEVSADGRPWKSLAFSVLPAQEERAPDATGLVPTAQGTVWTYSMTEQAAPGAKVDLQDVAPDADGRRRAIVTMTVTGNDAAGAHVELARDDRLLVEEWWHLDESGLAVAQRREGGEIVRVDPPQLLFPSPVQSPRRWEYLSADGSFQQTNHMWGPVPVEAPGGTAPGYVVLVEQGSLIPTTVERHFVPGVGMVREIVVSTAPTGALLNRQELVLEKKPELIPHRSGQ